MSTHNVISPPVILGSMNDEIRRIVKDRLQQKGLTQADLARLTGKHPNAVSRTLNGHKDGGTVPSTWAAILEALDLKLTAEPDTDE